MGVTSSFQGPPGSERGGHENEEKGFGGAEESGGLTPPRDKARERNGCCQGGKYISDPCD